MQVAQFWWPRTLRKGRFVPGTVVFSRQAIPQDVSVALGQSIPVNYRLKTSTAEKAGALNPQEKTAAQSALVLWAQPGPSRRSREDLTAGEQQPQTNRRHREPCGEKPRAVSGPWEQEGSGLGSLAPLRPVLPSREHSRPGRGAGAPALGRPAPWKRDGAWEPSPEGGRPAGLRAPRPGRPGPRPRRAGPDSALAPAPETTAKHPTSSPASA